ncbi:MAG TPA: SO2930 family diheme c-type cytochrome, partial [Kofleriaceae bacterium]|nr:SO2930 family diheme c-type cytochrome [Kofleriaceae bacterium]
MRLLRGIALGAVAAVAAVAACGGDDGDGGDGVDLTQPVVVDVTQPPRDRLSDYNLFSWDAGAGFTFNPTGDRIAAYDMNTQLFSDYALKQRAIYVPAGATITYDPELAFELPVGSVIIKSFAFPSDFRTPDVDVSLIETRLLIRYDDGWRPLPYIWNDAQTDAVLSPAGEVRAISFTDDTGQARTSNYLVPQRNQCQNCHGRKADENAEPEIVPIGVKARHLNRTYDYGGTVGVANQLDRMTAMGMLAGAPASTTITPAYDFRPLETGGVAALPPAELETAARAYLDINCAHCHDPNAVQGITSQLFLGHTNADLFRLGYCKRPGSAGAGTGGFEFDIVPGSPDTSILYFRLHTEDVGAMMPLIGRSLTHTRGSELIHAWIAAMPPDDCS